MLLFLFKCPLVVLWFLVGFFYSIILILLDFFSQKHYCDWVKYFASHWSKVLLKILNIDVQKIGETYPNKAALIVANHISWLDILVILAHQPCCMVAKKEVRSWPIIGYFAEIIGTVFIDRSNRYVGFVQEQMLVRLNSGLSVVFFPEGTTSYGPLPQDFRPKLFGLLLEQPMPLQYMAVAYPHVLGTHPTVPYLLEHDFISHFYQVLKTSKIHACLQISQLTYPEPTSSPRFISDQARAWIARKQAVFGI